MADNLRVQFAEIGQLNPDRETILTYIDDPKWSMVGKAVYQIHCTSCHGANGEGKIGPNLTDNLWKNVKVVEDIAKGRQRRGRRECDPLENPFASQRDRPGGLMWLR
ncbi:MAG: c-type cytochrome [Planctomycetaceae bacterium]